MTLLRFQDYSLVDGNDFYYRAKIGTGKEGAMLLLPHGKSSYLCETVLAFRANNATMLAHMRCKVMLPCCIGMSPVHAVHGDFFLRLVIEAPLTSSSRP